jgi:hypothetical protein
MTGLGGKGNQYLTSSLHLMQNIFRDMATGSGGEVRNKFRKDIARVFMMLTGRDKEKSKKKINVDPKLLDLFVKLEDTSISIEKAGELSKGVNFEAPISQEGSGDLCTAVSGAFTELIKKMQLHQQKDELIQSVIKTTLDLVTTGLSVVADTAEDTGIGVAATVGVKAVQAAIGKVDASWFSSKLNGIMRVTRTSFWNSMQAVVNPSEFNIKMDGKAVTNCNPKKPLKMLDNLKYAFHSLITKDDREKFRKACRTNQDEKTFRISTGKTVWEAAIEVFEKDVSTSRWGKLMSTATGPLGDAVNVASEKSKD